MKKHHFERKHARALFAATVMASAAVTLASCENKNPTATLEVQTTESTYLSELSETGATTAATTTTPALTLPETTTMPAAPALPESALPESTEQTTEQTTEAPLPVIRTESEEQREEIPFETVYEYSALYYEDEEIVKQKGKNGELLRVTVTTYEDDVALDASVTETVTKEPVTCIIVRGTADPISYSEHFETESELLYETEYQYDDSRYDDEKTVLQTGRNGYTMAYYRITYYKGTEIYRECTSRHVTKPQNEIISVGTKPAWTQETVTEKESIVSFSTEYVYDDTLEEGVRLTKTEGQDGYTLVTYTVKYYRGELLSKERTDSEVYAPVNEVIVIGTKKEEGFVLPFQTGQGYYLSQDYSNSHYALDFAVWYGDPILAVKSGTVIMAYDEGDFPKTDLNWTYGTFVVIEHEDGVRSLYAHLKSRTVSVGDRVQGGEIIGTSGNTGRVNPTPTAQYPLAGTHLHFEIRVKINGSYVRVDPKDYIPDF